MAGAITKIATATPSGVSSFSFTGIAASYDDLMIIGSSKSDTVASAAIAFTTMSLRFNADTGSNYFWFYNLAVDSSTRGASAQGPTWNGMYVPTAPGSYSSNTGWGHWKVVIPGYSDGSGNAAKRVYHLGGYGQGTHGSAMTQGNHGWSSTNAITEIGFYLGWGDFVAGSSATLYGITNS